MHFQVCRKRISSLTLAEKLGYSNNNILVIVNIDDIGLHKDETEASILALNSGIVKSGSIMVPAPNFQQVIEYWKENPRIELGVHLTLTCEWGNKYPWSPILPSTEVPTLYDSEGKMWQDLDELVLHANQMEVERELIAQITKVLDTGMIPCHMDYHMNFGFHKNLFPIVVKLARKFNLPMRAPKRKRFRLPFIKNNLWALRRNGYVFPDSRKGIYMLRGEDQSLEIRKKKYYDHLKSLKPGIHNIHIHTAFQTKELQDLLGRHDSSIRQIDYEVWTSKDTKMLAQELGIIFIGYRQLQLLQKDQIFRSV
jgi:chitin disaccharide deacetylase